MTAAALPQPLTSLIGRERDVAAVIAVLREDGARLVTLTGPGGTGKTRLAIQVAAEVSGSYSDDVWFVSLAPVRDPALVVSTIAQALGIRESADQPLLASLTTALGHRQMLLVLDNFEQVVGAAPLLSEVVGACRGLSILVTSRTPLHLYGERAVSVPPLAVPDASDLPSLDSLGDVAAVRLFVMRAQAAQSTFALTPDNARAVADICLRVDGLPLAIELASARIRLLTPQALAERLERRLPLLVDGPRDVPVRQQTLRATIAWSYDLLTPDERSVFRSLSIFLGGWTVDAAEAVCGQPDLFSHLAALVDHSLIRQSDASGAAARFGMLETIREYALERLGEYAELEGCRERHARFFLSMAEEAGKHLMGAGDQALLRQLEDDYGNLRLALDWALNHDVESGLRAASALWQFWLVHAHFDAGRRFLESALAADAAVDRVVRAQGLDTAASLASWQGDFGRAYELFETSLAIFREMNDEWNIANTLRGLGRAAMASGEFEKADDVGEESVAIFRTLDDPGGLQGAIGNLGWNALGTGNLERGRALLEEALTIAQQRHNLAGIANYTAGLAFVALDAGDLPRSTALFTETIQHCQEVGDVRFIALCFEGFGRIAARRDEFDRAARLFGAAETLRTAIGMAVVEAFLEPQLSRDIASVRGRLGASAYQAAWQAGQAMSVAHAITIALEITPPASPDAKPDASTLLASLGISARERDVLRLLVEGKSDREIAAELFISHHTVMRHVSNILGKLGVESRTAAATYAVRHNLQ